MKLIIIAIGVIGALICVAIVTPIYLIRKNIRGKRKEKILEAVTNRYPDTIFDNRLFSISCENLISYSLSKSIHIVASLAEKEVIITEYPLSKYRKIAVYASDHYIGSSTAKIDLEEAFKLFKKGNSHNESTFVVKVHFDDGPLIPYLIEVANLDFGVSMENDDGIKSMIKKALEYFDNKNAFSVR